VRDTLRRLQRDREVVGVTREHVEQRRLEVEHAAETVRTFKRKRATRPRTTDSDQAIREGDRVLIVSLGQEGDVLSISDDHAEIQLGTLKLRQPLENLTRRGRAPVEPQRRVTMRVAPAQPVPMEIDLRGHRAAEIEAMLERYLDEAYRSGLPMVRIIHGKGTGALRQVVRDLLSSSPIVARHELAPQNEGGEGATHAYLRE
jgi:DNA mismatch repair protein MutS2